MQTGIRIQGGEVHREALEAVSCAVVAIFRGAFETRMDQETVRAALRIVEQMGTVNGAHISNCMIGDGMKEDDGEE